MLETPAGIIGYLGCMDFTNHAPMHFKVGGNWLNPPDKYCQSLQVGDQFIVHDFLRRAGRIMDREGKSVCRSSRSEC